MKLKFMPRRKIQEFEQRSTQISAKINSSLSQERYNILNFDQSRPEKPEKNSETFDRLKSKQPFF